MDNETKMISKSYNSFNFKTWFIKNIKKIIFALALMGATTGTIGLVLGSISVNKTNNLIYYLQPDGTAVWGSSTIWVYQPDYPKYWRLYFDFEKQHDEDIVWDGKYPDWYFKDKN